ncbi:MAG TPA: HAD-IB family phosphatase [Actinomycetota bacterium]|nr:HAD-IB family phosphatase [Actinomycetota bacterium]
MHAGAILVDFDGTACLHDVAEHLLVRFGDPSWSAFDRAWERGEMGSRDVVAAQSAMLRAPLEELVGFALEHCPIDPTLPPFVAWARSRDVPVHVVSDGFGFYVEPLLAAAGLGDVPVITNGWRDGAIMFPNGHEVCVGCGTCKMGAVLEAREEHGTVAFVGEGPSDRYGALYADITFAKDVLVEIAGRDGVPLVPWNDFDDVRRHLETAAELPGPVAPVRCPGWQLPGTSPTA